MFNAQSSVKSEGEREVRGGIGGGREGNDQTAFRRRQDIGQQNEQTNSRN